MNAAAVDINDLYFSYGQRAVLSGVQVSFPKDRLSVLLGVNGSGKSTLFKIIAGLLPGYSGRISLMGRNGAGLKFKERAALIGFLPQFYQTVFSFSVEEILLTGRTAFSGFAPSRQDKVQADRIMAELGLQHLRRANFTQLSGGEQQMVMIGRLLMQNPAIIILDEPTNHLDVYYQNYLMEKLRHYAANGHTIIAVMHNPTLAYQYADAVFFMHNKTVRPAIRNGTADLALLQEVYGLNFFTVEYGGRKYILPEGK